MPTDQTRVLLVDDNPGDVALIKVALRQSSGCFQLSEADSLAQAITVARDLKPDVVLLDLLLPDSVGADTFVRFQQAVPDVAVVLITGIDDEAMSLALLQQGAQDYLVKGLTGPDVINRSIRYSVERRRAQQELERAEAKYRTLVEQMPAVTYIFPFPGSAMPQYVSPQVQQLYGYSPEEWLADTSLWHCPIHPDDLDRVLAAEASAMVSGRPYSDEYRFRARDGRIVWVRDQWTIVRDDDGRPLFAQGVLLDISEHKRLEEQLNQAQKMQTVGRLAGGVAHDFNNLLTAIMTSAEFVLERLYPGDSMRADVEEIIKASDRAASLTRQLLAFSRRQIIAPRVINLNDLILEMDKMLRRLIGEDIELVTLPAADLGQALADPGQIEQVLVNLAVNARDAMPQGGSLTIETANVTLDVEYGRRHVHVAPGPYVMFAVSDSGTGMTEEVREHLFEPFFTTKEMGQGTGLGLATIYGIVAQHGGHIFAYSEVGQGSTFKVYLPRVAEAAQPLARREEHQHRHEGTETVLLVEDEPMVRQTTARALSERGYAVIEAANGYEALQLAREYQGPIHLLLTDVVMPKMSGKELAKQMHAIFPDLPVLYVSGYTENAIVNHGILGEEINFVEKPYTAPLLARKVREVLDRTP